MSKGQDSAQNIQDKPDGVNQAKEQDVSEGAS